MDNNEKLKCFTIERAPNGWVVYENPEISGLVRSILAVFECHERMLNWIADNIYIEEE